MILFLASGLPAAGFWVNVHPARLPGVADQNARAYLVHAWAGFSADLKPLVPVADARALTDDLRKIGGVLKVELSGDRINQWVSIQKDSAADWNEIQPRIMRMLIDLFPPELRDQVTSYSACDVPAKPKRRSLLTVLFGK